MNEDVTVVITCFDYGAYLSESVHSALHQDGGEPRVIVVDDGSTDPHTLAELKRLPPRVRKIRQPNMGLAAARNSGLKDLDTPYALVLDADDRLAPDALTQLRRALEAEPRVGFSYGLVRFFGAWQGILSMPGYDPYRLLYRHNIGSTALMRRELLQDVGGYDPTFTGYEDWEFWLHALAHGWHGRRIERVALHYRRHGVSMNYDARRRYRTTFAQLRRKHPGLYERSARRTLESELSPLGRLTYRCWWGPRPLPARVEFALQAAYWRPRRGSAEPEKHSSVSV